VRPALFLQRYCVLIIGETLTCSCRRGSGYGVVYPAGGDGVGEFVGENCCEGGVYLGVVRGVVVLG
jgi:hypothetical protein